VTGPRPSLLPPIAVGLAALLAGLAGCGDREVPAAELGERLFQDPAVSTSRRNRFSCATCHTVAPGAPPVVPDRFDSGYNLAGVAGRPSWWGNYATSLLGAMNVCLEEFMGGRALRPDDDSARQLGAYLAAHSPPDTQPALPFTIVRRVTPLEGLAGDVARGGLIYAAGCQRCHGGAHNGSGRLDATFSIVPEDTQKAFPGPGEARFALVEKLRHGRFFNIGGVMPLYSLEALSDQDVADLLAYLGL
jgi:thiosulfate dehydrogenase